MDPSYSTLRGSGATVRPRMVHTVHGMHAPAIGDDVQWRNTSRGQTGLLYTHHSSGAAVGSVGAYTVGQRCFAPVWDCERACLNSKRTRLHSVTDRRTSSVPLHPGVSGWVGCVGNVYRREKSVGSRVYIVIPLRSVSTEPTSVYVWKLYRPAMAAVTGQATARKYCRGQRQQLYLRMQ